MRRIETMSRLRRDLRAELAGLLTGLGATPGEVADALARAGVRIDAGELSAAALDAYLRAVVGCDPAVHDLSLRLKAVVVRPAAGTWLRLVVPLPAGVRAFVQTFNAARFPQLLRHDARTGRPRPR